MARKRRRGLTGLSNRPTGWAAFRLLRQLPAPIPLRRHRNWVHGRYSNAHIGGCGSGGAGRSVYY
jgi:hypothetical protein